MDVDVQIFRLNGQMQQHKRILVLHHKRLVRLFNGFGHQAAADIAAVDKIIFKIPVASGNHRFPRESPDLQDLAFIFHRKQIGGNVPPEYGIDDVLQIVVARRVQAALLILNKPDGNIRMGHGHLFYQRRHVGALRLGGF